MNNIFNDKDELIMKLVHYFVTKENYAPILVNGVQNEIWLENLDSYYKIIRINTNYLHNTEQVDLDTYKILNVCKQISKKTLSRKLKTLNILTNINDGIKINDRKNIDTLVIENNEDLNKEEVKELFPNIIEEETKDLHGIDFLINVSNDINTKTEKENSFYEKVFSPKKIIVTNVLIIINVLVYIISTILTKANIYDIYTNFALNKYFIKQGEIYRLITCGFLHADIIHLFCNMYSLYIIGSQIENFIGKKKYLLVYFISMLTGSLLSTLLTNSWSVGASGAIFGLLGSLIYFGYHYRIYLGSVLKTQLIPLIILNLGIGFIVPGIDVSAHIGGLVGGILSTMSLGIENKSSKTDRINGTICLLILIIFLSILIFK